jgi:hypothetical protein
MAVVQQELLVSSQESNEIHDIFLRLSNIQKDISAPVLPSLAGIEKNILKGVVLSQYEYGGLESSDVILTGDAVDANTLLQQVERFQSSGVFSNVQLKSVGFSEQGYLLFTLQMGFANQNKK